MPYKYRDDLTKSDVAFEAWGGTLEELIEAAGDATLNVMVEDLSSISPAETRTIQVEEESPELLLFQLLQELIYYKDAEELLLRYRKAQVEEKGGKLLAIAEAAGERIDPERHALIVDVKAVTLHRFKVVEENGIWRATVVLDV